MNSCNAESGPETDCQADVLRFLMAPRNHGDGIDHIERIETHGAVVILAGGRAIKIKKAVTYSYMDFSTLALREAAIRRELAVNQPAAPEIYQDVVAIVRGSDGQLAWGDQTDGKVVEWALRMRRFSQDDLLSARIGRGGLDPRLLERLADAVFQSHACAPKAAIVEPTARLERIAGDICKVLVAAAGGDEHFATQVGRLHERMCSIVTSNADLIDARARAGFIRRCHGDLHLDNVVVFDEGPVLFDAIEFSEEVATVDVLYDLAFLLMDLCHRGDAGAANAVLNRYIWRDGTTETLVGLRLLALFMGLRAGIRAMVTAQRTSQTHQASDSASVRAYLKTARAVLAPNEPRLIAIGGLSGTGKSTLAAALAPIVGQMPGAVHLRSDLERKALAGVEADARLPHGSYTQEASASVYQRLAERAALALESGVCVIVDAVFAGAVEREMMADLAARAGGRFDGVWLIAAREMLIERVAHRQGDASDATPDVVRRQLEYDVGEVGWQRLDSGRAQEFILADAKNMLGLASRRT